MILQKVKSDAEAYLGEKVTDAVITVPAYFNGSQRQATKDAGKIAGFNVRRLINEPTAATLAYGIDKGEGEQIVMVYDLRRGTFDVSLLESNPGIGTLEIKSTSGDAHLGGDDFDSQIVDYVISEFKRQKGIDLSSDISVMQRLIDAAEKAKIELSNVVTTSINLPFITVGSDGQPKHLDMTLTRAKFDELTAYLVDQTIGRMEDAIKSAGLTKDKINRVLLVGGATRMPSVIAAVERFTGKAPYKNINPDEAFAMGAAIQGGVLSGEVNEVLPIDITTESKPPIDDEYGKAHETIKSAVEEEPEPKITIKSKSEYHGANIDFKVSIENQLDHSIADVKATLFVPQVFLLSEKEKTIGLIKPKERQTTTFAIRPTGECGDCVIEGEVTYFDTASNSHERIRIKPKSVAVKCAILKRFKTGDDAWFDLVTNLISTKETHEEIPVPAETLFNVATDALRSMNMSMLKPVRNSAPGYFSGSARYAALGAAGGMKYAAQLNVIGSEAGSSRLVLEAWAEEESALVGFYHRMLDRLEEQTRVKEYISSVFIAGDYVSGQKQVVGGDIVGGTKITGDVVATRSTIGGGGGGKPFSNCPHCGETLNLPKTPKFCPYCGGQMS